MRIVIDAMGGDHAPAEIVRGAVDSARQRPDVTHILVGLQDAIRAELSAMGPPPPNILVEHASEVIGMDEHPADALRQKRDSSINKGLRMVREDQADAFISAGNTGAVVGYSIFRIGCLEGVKRPGIAVPIPTEKSFAVLIDVGANVYCKPIHLLQYGVMGSVYVQALDPTRPQPTLGLLNVGEERGKGNELVKEATEHFQKSSLNFRGNVEGHRIFSGDFDVVVCDGFVGNALLKMAEGFTSFVLGSLLNGLSSEPQAREQIQKVADRLDYSATGGAPLLGIKGIVLIAHGRSKGRAITNAIGTAVTLTQNKIKDRIVEEIKKYSWWGRIHDWFAARPPSEEPVS